jgi:hypothetical protein
MSGGVIHAGASTARLTAAMANAPAHLQAILGVVRDLGVGMLFAGQGADAFRIPRETPRRPAIVMIGDDMEQSRGPDGFHLPSVRRAIRACSDFAVITAAPDPDVYAQIAIAAALGRTNAMLVETRIEHEFAWVALIRKLAPHRPLTVLTIKGGHA